VRVARKKVVIVGAGGAGLAALHAMHQAGFDAIAFEQHAALGGVWATTKYPSLAMHSKSFSYRFHDYSAMTSHGPSATGEEVRAYFAAYARDKQIADKVVYGRRVEKIVYRSTRGCLVITDAGNHECDLVVCATGYSNTGRPHVPVLEGRASSRVRVLHSGEVSPEIVNDIVANRRKVVVLGAGRSAHEILSLLRERIADVTWVYVKSLWSMSYEKLYSDPKREPWNAALYFYYMGIQALRRKFGWSPLMKRLQAPLVRSGYLINPLEQDSDVCRNRGAIMKADQFAFLKTVRSVEAGVIGLGDCTVLLDRGEPIEADYLICATGYDRRADLPAVAIEHADGTLTDHPLAAQHGFYLHLIDPAVPAISILSATILYSQHILGFSLAAQWLARFHQGRLTPQPTTRDMTRWIERRARDFPPWYSGEYLSGGMPYAHHRDKDVLPTLFEQMGLPRRLAQELVLRGTDERAFAEVCDRVAQALRASASSASR
jgi:dimethylaniline monooxygenase (N-oxide forming)